CCPVDRPQRPRCVRHTKSVVGNDGSTPTLMSATDRQCADDDRSGSRGRKVGSVVMLVFSDHGGLADYAHEQACELVRRGIDLTVLCKNRFAADREGAPYRMKCLFVAEPEQIRTKALRQTIMALVVILNE